MSGFLNRLFGKGKATPKDIVEMAVQDLMAAPEDNSQAAQIALSLRDFPEDWAWDVKGYKVKHVPSGFIMWVGNGERHLAEKTDYYEGKFTEREQKVIWPAFEHWLDRFKTSFSAMPPKPRLAFQRGHWFCRSSEQPWVGVGGSAKDAYASWVRAVSVQARKTTRESESLYVWSWK